jgi:hypothetical protein
MAGYYCLCTKACEGAGRGIVDSHQRERNSTHVTVHGPRSKPSTLSEQQLFGVRTASIISALSSRLEAIPVPHHGLTLAIPRPKCHAHSPASRVRRSTFTKEDRLSTISLAIAFAHASSAQISERRPVQPSQRQSQKHEPYTIARPLAQQRQGTKPE